jgi:hypothetical protein
MGGVGIPLGIALVARRRRRAPQRALEGATPIAIAAMPQGERVKITGVVGIRDSLITSPAGHPCIGFRIIIKGVGREWELVQREDCRSFLLTDDTGTVVVDGPFAFALDVDDGASLQLPPSVYKLFEDTIGEKRALACVRREEGLSFQEAVLRPGDRISVLGRSAMELDPAAQGSYREPPMLNHIRGSEKDPVVIADAEEVSLIER